MRFINKFGVLGMEGSLVSVIIPTYKRAPFLRRAIESIKNQTYSDIEVIVVDDNGVETTYQKETEQVIDDMRKSIDINYIIQPKNSGGAVARNVGIRASHGEYITFLDDDDFYLPNRVERLVNFMRAHQCLVAYSACIMIWNKTIKNAKGAFKSDDPTLDILSAKSIMGTGSNMFFHRSIFQSILFDESFKRHQDFEFMVRALQIENNQIYYDCYPSVVKDTSNPINIPNIESFISLKQQYLQNFEPLIDAKYKNYRNQIYQSNYIECYKAVLLSNDKKYKKEILTEIKKRGKFSFSDRFRIDFRSIIVRKRFLRACAIRLSAVIEKKKIDKEVRDAVYKIIMAEDKI